MDTMLDNSPSTLEQHCVCLAAEFGIVLQEERPSRSFLRYRSGTNGHDRLEYALAADQSEHMRVSTTDEQKPYVLLACEAGAPRYRLSVEVPAEALQGFVQRQTARQANPDETRVGLAKTIADAIHLGAVLPDRDAAFTIWMLPQELGQVTAELVRNYLC